MVPKTIQDKFIKAAIKKGKKTKNYFIYNQFLFDLKKNLKPNSKIDNKSISLMSLNEIINESVNNILPKLLINDRIKKKRKIKPFILVNEEKQLNISIKWLLKFSTNNYKNLIKEIIDLSNYSGKVITNKIENYENIRKLLYTVRR